ncbi:MAG: UDP-N-acetylmuramate dehydrogenase [Prevotella sp.]|nr:UDP-N-acetylmuramate dehydrogenase [Prevotella sp.]
MKSISNYSLLKHNTFNIDARCRRFLEYETADEAMQIAERLTDEDRPLLVIGGGSNLLLTRDYPSTVVRSAVMGIHPVDGQSTADSVLLRCGSGEKWDDVVEYCVSNGFFGAENLSLIPGDVGASAVQNIGAYGVEIKDIVDSIEAVDLHTCKSVVISASECNYGYRESRFKNDWCGRFLITHVTYRLSRQFIPKVDYGQIRAELDADGIAEPTARQLRDVIIRIRKDKLPDTAVEGNAGSFFVNPVVSADKFRQLQEQWSDIPYYIISPESVKIPAGWLIEQCGWKGKTVGRAGVHARQALVLVNRGGATGNEILSLCNTICADVERKFGITIKPEVNIV